MKEDFIPIEFGMVVEKTFEVDGRKMVTAVVADTEFDRDDDSFTPDVIRRFAEELSKGIGLYSSHKESFPFGKSVRGRVFDNDKGGLTLEADFVLDERYPQSAVLWEEMQSGGTDKQLSVGARINRKNPQAVKYVGSKRKLADCSLDHITTTRPKIACNPRTRFLSAEVLKSLDESMPGWDQAFKESDVSSNVVTKPYSGPSDPSLPPSVRRRNDQFRRVWVSAFNSAMSNCGEGETQGECEGRAFRLANGVSRRYAKGLIPEEMIEKELPGLLRLIGLMDDDDETEDPPRTLKDLPTMLEMKLRGYTGYVAPIVYPGSSLYDAIKDVKDQHKNKVLVSIHPATKTTLDVVKELMIKSGIKKPEKEMKGSEMPLFMMEVGSEDLNNKDVGLSFDGRPVLYVKAEPDQLNNGGEREFGDNSELTGGGFHFVEEGRKLPGEPGYSPIWPIPSIIELQILAPEQIEKVRGRRNDDEEDEDTDKFFGLPPNEDEKNQNGSGVIGTSEPGMVHRILVQTSRVEGHSHALFLTLNAKNEVMYGKTDMFLGHYHRVSPDLGSYLARADDNQIVEQLVTEKDQTNHQHTFTLNFDQIANQRTRLSTASYKEEDDFPTDEFQKSGVEYKALGSVYFASHPEKGIEVWDMKPDAARLCRVPWTYGIVEFNESSAKFYRIGQTTKVEAVRLASEIAHKEGIKNVWIGRTVGSIGHRKLFKGVYDVSKSANAKIVDHTEDLVEKTVVPFKSYPRNDSAGWSFTAAEGNAILNKFGGMESDAAWSAFRDAHTWYDPEAGTDNPPRVKGAYAFPHHKLDGGTMKTYRSALTAAMIRLNGGRAPVRWYSEREGMYNHLARHYREFDLEPPPLRKESELFDEEAFVAFHVKQGIDEQWMRKVINQIQEEDKMKEEEKVETTPPAKEEVKTPLMEAEQAKKDEGIIMKVLKALGGKEPSLKQIKVGALAKAIQEEIAGLETSDDVSGLLELMSVLGGARGMVMKKLAEADIEQLPYGVAVKVMELRKQTEAPKTEETKDAPKTESEDALIDKIAAKVMKKVGRGGIPEEQKEEQESPKTEDKKEETPAEETKVQDEGKVEAPADLQKQTEEKKEDVNKSAEDVIVEKVSERMLGTLQPLMDKVDKIAQKTGVQKTKKSQEDFNTVTRKGSKPGIFKGILANTMNHQSSDEE